MEWCAILDMVVTCQRYLCLCVISLTVIAFNWNITHVHMAKNCYILFICLNKSFDIFILSSRVLILSPLDYECYVQCIKPKMFYDIVVNHRYFITFSIFLFFTSQSFYYIFSSTALHFVILL